MGLDTGKLKSFFASRREEIALAHRNGADGFSTCSALASATDEVLSGAFQLFSSPENQQPGRDVAVLALGGYGRAEVFPRSDIDLMILCESGDRKESAGEAAKEFLHLLWDLGLDVGHSVRTIDEALGLYGESAESWASILESRFVCGNRQLSDAFNEAVRGRIRQTESRWFVEGVFRDLDSRHQRYGNSVKLLEPNVKKSAGGLRDFHMVFWLYRGTDPALFVPLQSSLPAALQLLELLEATGRIEPEERRVAGDALRFLFRTRHAMHYLRDSLHDTLEYALQLEVAESLGFGPRNELRSVEVFMREYYLHARNLHQTCRKLTQHFREFLEPPQHAMGDAEHLGDGLLMHNGILTVEVGTKRFKSASAIFEAFVVSAENDVELDFRIRGVIERSLTLIRKEEQHSPELAAKFRRIIGSKQVAKTLHAMNELGVLGRYIPEFGDLVAFFQHNVYHYFTADEHTLIAVANAERLREQPGVMHEVFRALQRKDMLYMAIVLHDIAKPHGVADHEVTGVEMAREILTRLGMDDMIPRVAFLIRNHLVMEQTAFRRNIHDPQTIKEFAARFESAEQLDYLYLLTYADLSALNINVWTEWKSSILQDLYVLTSEVLRRKLRGAELEEFQKRKHAAARVDLVDRLSTAIPREHVERHLEGMQNDAYIASFTEEEISKHIQHSASSESITALFATAEGYTEITILARDAPFALSKFCAVLSANDANIFDANIFTRDDGIIIDRFRVTDASTKDHLEQGVCEKITEDLKQVVEGTLDIEHLFERHRRKWRRRRRLPVNPNVRVGVEFEDTPRFTIIEVYAPDSVGFLFRVTETISKLGLDIYFAKIATRVDGIVDAFYTLDRSGQPVVGEEKRAAIRQEILSTIQTLAVLELT